MRRILVVLCLAACVQAADQKTKFTDFSGALERLAATVAPAVVQVQVSGWCASRPAGSEDSGVWGPCRVVGSGVIVDSSGYIITNEHVVRNARSIRVMLTPKPDPSHDKSVDVDRAAPDGKQQVLDSVILGANREPVGKRQVYGAEVVGTSRETDIALLKIDASGLPVIPLQLPARGPRQGQIALAVGSPEGLDNTMTIGIVSSVGRQPHPDYPMLYIQTDAAINPGNSGGPLLNIEGELIGINTFIVSESGHSQGLGFALPAAVVRYVYGQLRTHGSVRQSLVGVHAQTITPAIADGLHLSRGYGVMVSDVVPGSPAEIAGLRPLDIITAVDGASISAVPYYTAMMYLHDPTTPVSVTVLRGGESLQVQMPAFSTDDQAFKDTSMDPLESFIPELGVFGKSVNATLRVRNGLRSRTGIYVFARSAGNEAAGVGLAAGDVITSLNGTAVGSIQELRVALRELTDGKPAIVQIERNGLGHYLEWQLETGTILKADPSRSGR